MIKILKEYSSKNIILNPDSTHFGRSAYLCYNKDCLNISIKKKKLQKSLRLQLPVFFQSNLEELIDNKKLK